MATTNTEGSPLGSQPPPEAKDDDAAVHTDSEGDDPQEPLNGNFGVPIGDLKPPATFINHGLIRWEAARNDWLQLNNCRAPDSTAKKTTAKSLPVDEIIDIIFASPKQWRARGGPQAFPTNVPLPQMIDILQDLWEAEGLDI